MNPPNPSDYLRIRPPYRRFEAGRQWANHRALRSAESHLRWLNWYRDRLDNPGLRRAV